MSTSQLLHIQCLEKQWMQQACTSLLPQQQPTRCIPPQQPIQLPQNVDMNPLLEEVMLAIQHGYTSDKSNGVHGNKTKEYFQYHPTVDHNYNKVLEAKNKLYQFMFYQAFGKFHHGTTGTQISHPKLNDGPV
jgi:hypothetical protein